MSSQPPPAPSGVPAADRVLVVAGNPAAAWSLAVLLEEAEFAVRTASAPAAFAAAGDFRPQAVLAELPPAGDGRDLLDRLAALPDGQRPLLVVMVPRPVGVDALTPLLREACAAQRRAAELRPPAEPLAGADRRGVGEER